MSAPTSGSSGSSANSSGAAGSSGSAEPAGAAASPVPGYYPDPSVPDYIRYWNGSSWVPGTSRPAPPSGAGPAQDPAPALPAVRTPSGPPAVPARHAGPAIDESGPMFLDEDPLAPQSETPGPAWPVPAPRGQGLPPISWGAPATPAVREPRREPGHEAPPAPARSQPVPPPPAAPAAPVVSAVPVAPRPLAPEPQPQQAPPWAAQVHDLARQGGAPVPGRPASPGEPVVPWRPVAADPFAGALSQGRPGGLVRRFAARVIDTVLGGALVGLAAVPLGTAAYHHAKDKVDAAKLTGETVRVWLIDGTTGVQLGAVLVVAIAVGLLLEVLPTAKWGRTLGKKLVGLRVLDIEAQQPPGFGASLRRWLTHAVLDLLVIGVVSLTWCLFDRPWKQCWHDKAARTFVAAD